MIVDPAHYALAKKFGSHNLIGPPVDDRLVALVGHLFSPEEAAVAVHIPPYFQMPAEKIARRAGKTIDDIGPLLDAMDSRRVVFKGKKGYAIFPVFPGLFECVLMDGSDSDWHRRFAGMIDEIVGSGYMKKYNNTKKPMLRNIPVNAGVECKNHVAGPEFMEELIAAHSSMSVLNVCQCRQSTGFKGHDCQRSVPAEGCLVFGELADISIKKNVGRRVTKEEMHAIVRQRISANLVFMTANVKPSNTNTVCTCCECCCKFLQSVNNFNGRVSLASPGYGASVIDSLCSNCGMCIVVCNTYAHTLDGGVHVFDPEKCIGCGLCVSACKQGAISMTAKRSYGRPAATYGRLILKLFPRLIISRIKRKLSEKRMKKTA